MLVFPLCNQVLRCPFFKHSKQRVDDLCGYTKHSTVLKILETCQYVIRARSSQLVKNLQKVLDDHHNNKESKEDRYGSNPDLCLETVVDVGFREVEGKT